MFGYVIASTVWNKLLFGGEALIWDVICQLLVEMAKENGLDQHFIPHSSLESCCAHSCSGTFSSFQVKNNVREIYYPHEMWGLFWVTVLFPVRPKFSPFQRLLSASEKVVRHLWIARRFPLEKREQQCNDYIRCTVGRDKIVLMLVNGGVDSAVCAALFLKAFL
ncbi:GMP synthase-like protein [Daphnia magna]|uniref:GMP synthase-like protein n=1 Tax=Daphnia magna TaxID=35525 RepID=A0A162SMA7_9CRUS|nr:GMP synthase-like protein [Daphnia magna]